MLILVDLEELVELGDLKHFVDLRVNIAEDQPPPRRLELLVQRDELAQRGTGEVLHVAEIQQQLADAIIINQAEQLLADELDVLLIENFLVDEIDDRDVANLLDFEPTPSRLR